MIDFDKSASEEYWTPGGQNDGLECLENTSAAWRAFLVWQNKRFVSWIDGDLSDDEMWFTIGEFECVGSSEKIKEEANVAGVFGDGASLRDDRILMEKRMDVVYALLKLRSIKATDNRLEAYRDEAKGNTGHADVFYELPPQSTAAGWKRESWNREKAKRSQQFPELNVI